MLGLFQEEEVPLMQEEAHKAARAILVSFLNKGNVPTWEQLFNELPVLGSAEDLEAVKFNFMRLTRWDFLREILEMEGTEFFFHSPHNSQRLLLNGRRPVFQVPIHEEDWQLWLEIIAVNFKRNWNVQSPFESFYAKLFGKTYRLSLIHGSTSPDGRSKMMVRCLASSPHPLSSFGQEGILQELIRKKNNFLVAGSTGSGKTSLLSSLLQYIDPEEHLVVLEDTYEIFSDHAYQTRLLAGGTQETSLKTYLSYCMRLSPDRIVLGEMRSHEVVPFLMAMNTGHKGLLGTVHASSGVDALHRVALLFSIYGGEGGIGHDKVMDLLCRNLEYVVFMENKKVKEVIKVLGSERGVPFFECQEGPVRKDEALEKFSLF